jgi:tRNA A-37 threonylcarbamoyl transferase component Bud32
MFNIVGKSLGRYHVVEQLGEGGMATVFKAYDSSLERFVAIKVIRTEIVMDQEFLKRFQREARALAQLDHPYILKVLDYGEQDGMPYLVMPFAPGGTLKERMGSPWPYQEAARLLAPVARALECAHQLSIIHRDVKPANILFTPSGSPILSDFGIAKMLDIGESMQLTGTGMGIGTPDYMAPEQWLGKVDARTDIYALGVVFYEMVTGRRPYTADTPAAVMLKHMQDPLPRPRSINANLPDEVEQVIFKALAKQPEDRYQDMGAFAAALEKISSGPVLQARPGMPMQIEPTMRASAVARPATGPRPLTGSRPVTGPVTAPAPVSTQQANSIKKWTIGGIAVAALVIIGVCLAGVAILFAVKSPLFFPGNPTSLAQVVATGANTPAQAVKTTRPPAAPGGIKATLPAGQMATKTVTAGPTETLPPLVSIEGLPADVPMLPQNYGDLITSNNNNMSSYFFTTWLPFDQAAEYYRKAMLDQGWTLVNTASSETPPTKMYTFGKDNNQRMVNVEVMLPKTGQHAMIMLMLVTPQ